MSATGPSLHFGRLARGSGWREHISIHQRRPATDTSSGCAKSVPHGAYTRIGRQLPASAWRQAGCDAYGGQTAWRCQPACDPAGLNPEHTLPVHRTLGPLLPEPAPVAAKRPTTRQAPRRRRTAPLSGLRRPSPGRRSFARHHPTAWSYAFARPALRNHRLQATRVGRAVNAVARGPPTRQAPPSKARSKHRPLANSGPWSANSASGAMPARWQASRRIRRPRRSGRMGRKRRYKARS